MTITLQEITRENWRQCIKLQAAENQRRFVAPNMYSLAQSKYEPESMPLAIYDDDTMVGFVMYAEEDYLLSKIWFIQRLMIDQQHQGHGYGRAGMQALIDRLKVEPGHEAILISFVPDNEVARMLYSSLGFEDTGEIEGGELVFRLPIKT